MRLIDTDAFIAKYCESCGGGCNLDDFCCVTVDDIMKAPTIDAVPVVHGRWILPTKIGHRYFDIPHCSACDGVPCGVDENTNYCPNCGAKMDGERKDNGTD